MGASFKTLGSQEVCAILEASAKAKVTKLKFGGLEVEFGQAPIPALDFPKMPPSQWQQLVNPAPSPVTAITEEQKRMIAAALRQEEVLLKDDQLANALVEDPVLAEEMLEEELLKNTELENDVSSE